METTAESSTLKKFNPANFPPAGSEWVGKYFNKIWEDARKEKIGRLGLHQRFLELHAAYRGKKRKKTYPRVGANFIFKIIEAYCATLTEKDPIADISADDADNHMMVKALSQEAEEWWKEAEQQQLLFVSSKDKQIYGTTIEKGVWNSEKDDFEIILRDIFNCFPAPGYKMCDLDIPYWCDVDFLEDWEIRSKFGIDENVTIPADADEQLAGTIRETTTGGAEQTELGRHYPTTYAPIKQSEISESLKDKTMVVEIWIRDDTEVSQPITETMIDTDGMGNPVTEPYEYETGKYKTFKVYPDGVRKVVICPALLSDIKIRGVLDDTINPNINWDLLDIRAEELVNQGVEPEDALMEIYERAKISYPLWGKFPYSATPSRIDSTQWWGFSIIEQLEEQQGKAEQMLTKYFTCLERAMFPIFMNIQGSGVQNSEITNEPGIVINPTVATAPYMGYIDSPPPPREYLEAIELIMRLMDIISLSPEVTEGRRPKGVSAASAIIALQDKAATLFGPQVRQVDRIIRDRGRMYIHFKMNFDTKAKQVKVDDQFINFRGIDIFSKFKYDVESGSSAPITKAGRRAQMVELRKMGDVDRLSLLEQLNIPQAKLINERLTEDESVPGALKILVQAGLPIESAQQLYGFLMQDQFVPQPTGGTTGKTPEEAAPQAGGYSEGMTSANTQMSDLREG